MVALPFIDVIEFKIDMFLSHDSSSPITHSLIRFSFQLSSVPSLPAMRLSCERTNSSVVHSSSGAELQLS